MDGGRVRWCVKAVAVGERAACGGGVQRHNGEGGGGWVPSLLCGVCS